MYRIEKVENCINWSIIFLDQDLLGFNPDKTKVNLKGSTIK